LHGDSLWMTEHGAAARQHGPRRRC
jgi:hypothetical protein